MNDQPLPTLPPRSNRLGPALMIVLGVGAVGFAVLSIVEFGQAHSATTTLNAQKQSAAAVARADQKQLDEAAAVVAGESPFRSYTAPAEYGSFEIKFPKDWSSTVDEERTSSTQVLLVVNPNFVHRSNGQDALAAAKIALNQRTLADAIKLYSGQKTLTQSDVTVSGIKSVQFSGSFNDKRSTRVVIVPVRDKTIIFTNENQQYSHEFDAILAQSKIVP
jgi:hypothetical protein